MADSLRRMLERLAERGTPRGAQEVLSGARSGPPRSSAARAWAPMAAVAASIALVAGVAVAVGNDRESGRERLAGLTTTTTEPDAPTTPARAGGDRGAATTIGTGGVTTTGLTTTTAGNASTGVRAAAVRLQAFDDCRDFVGTVKAQALQVVGPYGLPGSSGARRDLMASPTAGQAPSMTKDGAAKDGAAAPETALPDDTSGTNVQEAGIDEPDTVKTDGTTMFVLSAGRVFAVAARGAPRIVGSLAVAGAEALLVGNRLVVLGHATYTYRRPAGGAGFAPAYGGSSITVVDVANPAAMRVTSSMSVDGSYVSARLVDGVARIVLRSAPVGLEFEYPRDDTKAARERAAAHNREVVRSSSIDNWAPHVTVTDAAGRTARQGTLMACGAAYQPPQLAGFGMLTVLTLDPASPAASGTTSIVADGDLVYASTERLYVATNQWGRIVDFQTVEPSVRTLVHAFAIEGRANARYVASGSVRGTALNQFSFSEHGGRLRVATTDLAGGTSESWVTVLAATGRTLTTVGQVGGLGRGERIYAVRFIGDVGYVVTFRQVDPLYVIDLSVPSNPRVVGELKVEGYSAYLHPVGDGLLLGVGQDATPEGRRSGSQVSLFDVSDPANPRRLQKAVLGDSSSSSPAEFDHHAFLWWAPTKLAVLPLSQHDQQQPFTGAVGLRVSAQSLAEAGRVQHPSMQSSQPGYRPMIERSVVVGGRLFTISVSGVLASDLATLQDQAWVAFPQPEPQPEPRPEPRPEPQPGPTPEPALR